jgi:hypothetical protein
MGLQQLFIKYPLFLTIYSSLVGFSLYFSIYAYRKPVYALTFQNQLFLDRIDLKTSISLGQLFGYTISKYLGVFVVSNIKRDGRRIFYLLGLAAWAESTLVLFALVPRDYKVLAMFLNGLRISSSVNS